MGDVGLADMKERVFRQSRLWLAVGVAVCWAMAGVGLVILREGAGWMGWVFILGALLTSLPLLVRLHKAFSADNWLLRSSGRRLLIRVGPMGSRDPDRVFLIELERSEVEWIGTHRKVVLMREAQEVESCNSGYLLIKPRALDAEALSARLAEAQRPRRWRGWTIIEDVPVSITAEGAIRLLWYGRNLVIAPGLKKAARILERDYRIQEEVLERNDFTRPDADAGKMEEQILDFAAEGRKFDAILLAQKRYGCSLSEAKEFVEGLGVRAE